VGGIRNPHLPHGDSLQKVSTGIVAVTPRWQEPHFLPSNFPEGICQVGVLRNSAQIYPNGAQCSNQSPKGLVGGEARLDTNPLAPDNGHRNEPGQSGRCWSWAENARTPQALSWSVCCPAHWPWAERPGNSTQSGSLGGSRS